MNGDQLARVTAAFLELLERAAERNGIFNFTLDTQARLMAEDLADLELCLREAENA